MDSYGADYYINSMIKIYNGLLDLSQDNTDL